MWNVIKTTIKDAANETIPTKPRQRKSKWLSVEAIKISEDRRKAKARGFIDEDVKPHHKKAFDCVDHCTLFNALTEVGVPTHLIVRLRNSYSNQQATVRSEYGDTDSFSIGKGVRQGCILSPVGVRQGCILSPVLFNI